MMTLYILRHGIAVERGAPGYPNDHDRPLTPEGANKIRLLAKALRRLKIEFDVLLTSPLVRARRTAEIVAGTFQAKKRLEICDDLADDGDPRAVIRHLCQRDGSVASAMLVGHEPYLSEFVSMLLTGDKNLPLTLKKGGLCKLSCSRLRYGRCATLEWLLSPRLLTDTKTAA